VLELNAAQVDAVASVVTQKLDTFEPGVAASPPG
jgi:hypothetical protein